jgi:hypothetical protein
VLPRDDLSILRGDKSDVLADLDRFG